MTHKWVRDKPLHRVGKSTVERGDEFTPSEAVKENFGEWIEPVNPKGETPEDTDAESEDAESVSEGSEDNSDEGSETETFACGVNGCSREVDSESDTCWQHESS